VGKSPGSETESGLFLLVDKIMVIDDLRLTIGAGRQVVRYIIQSSIVTSDAIVNRQSTIVNRKST
jgi:hypothetical protein